MPRAAAIYARISSDPEGDRLGVGRQIADCEALATRRGWPVLDRYVDDDRSAYSGKPRPEYRRMLDDIRSGVVDAVMVYHLDRLHRQPKELEAFFEVCDAAGVKALATVQGDIDLSTDDGRFHARIMGAVARKSSDDQSRRVRRKHLELAQAGEPAGGGYRPFGYRTDRRTIEPTEAPAIREAAARVLAGASLRSTASELNDRAVLTSTGHHWSVQSLRRMLLSTRLSGQRAYRGEIVAEGRWEAILTPDETARLRAILTDPARLTRRTVRRYLLAGGLLRCGRCGSVMTARPRADRVRRYVCAKGPGLAGCGGTFILAEPTEAYVAAAVLHRLDTPELAARLAGQARESLSSAAVQADLDRDQDQLAALAAAFGRLEVTLPEWLAARKPIQQRIEASKRRLSRDNGTAIIGPYVGAADSLAATWADLPLTRQHAVLAAVLDHVVVKPGTRGRTRFEPSRLEPVWRI